MVVVPKSEVTQEFKLATRNSYTTVDAVITISVDGREPPNLGVIGEAVDKAIELVATHVKESYNKVPERDGTTPIKEPYKVGE